MIFITFVHPKASSKDIKEQLKQIGVLSRSVKLAAIGRRHRGFGFITLKSGNLQDEPEILHRIGQMVLYDMPVCVSKTTDKRDMLFPYYSYLIRSQLKLDAVSLYSVTDQFYAQATSRLIASVLSVVGAPPLNVDSLIYDPIQVVPLPVSITDGLACAGGNTLSFGHHFERVTSVELDSTRVQYLQHNVQLCGLEHRISVVQGNYLDLYPLLSQDVVFLDPPFGGPAYSPSDPQSNNETKVDDSLPDPLSNNEHELHDNPEESAEIQGESEPSPPPQADSQDDPEALHENANEPEINPDAAPEIQDQVAATKTPKNKSNKWYHRVKHAKQKRLKEPIRVLSDLWLEGSHPDTPSLSFTRLCLQLRLCCDLLVLKLPHNFDAVSLAAQLVSAELWSSEQKNQSQNNASDFEYEMRPFPFHLKFGSVSMMLICFPPRPTSRFCFGNHVLDRVIPQILDWSSLYYGDHHPAFYDWEKARFISLSRWKGAQKFRAVKQ